MKPSAIFLFIVISLFGQASHACVSGITSIKVLNNDFKVIKIISSQSEILKFQTEWCSLKKIQSPANTNWTNKLDIEGGELSGRWLYNSNGYISRLNYQLKPSYQVPNAISINKILGL